MIKAVIQLISDCYLYKTANVDFPIELFYEFKEIM